ncbi:hypothetical protein BC833DRAFT_648714, partial [Globomyces pollinis-pini]
MSANTPICRTQANASRAFSPLFDSYALLWSGGNNTYDHQRKITLSFDYNLLDDDDFDEDDDDIITPVHDHHKYYISYSIGGVLEGKTDNFTHGHQTFSITHDVNVSQDFLSALYQKPSEFILWQVVSIEKDLKKKKKKNEVKEKVEEKVKTVMSLANTGGRKKKSGKNVKVAQFTTKTEAPKEAKSIDTTVVEIEPFDNTGWFSKSNSNPQFDLTALNAANTALNRRPGSASPVLSRGVHSAKDGKRSAGTKKTINRVSSPGASPHHYNHPEKHMDSFSLRNGLIRSRSSSFTNTMEILRPKTPPSPHHFAMPQATITKRKVLQQQAEREKHQLIIANNPVKSTKTKKKKQVEVTVMKEEKSLNWSAEFRTNSLISSPSRRLELESSLNKRENDIPIEKIGEKPLTERRKGDYIHYPIDRVPLDLGMLFFKSQSISAKISKKCEYVSKCTMKLELDDFLLSEGQAQWLNPMVITILNATGMPNNPVTYQELDRQCLPVFSKFRFFIDPYIHTSTMEVNHQENLSFGTNHVILVGLLDQTKLIDAIKRSKFVVEIHDRDFKYRSEMIEEETKFLESGVIQKDLNPENPFGQAFFDMSELFDGLTDLIIETPILPFTKLRNKAANSMQQGNWVESNSSLSMHINIRHPIKKLVSLVDSSILAPSYIHWAAVTTIDNSSEVHRILDYVTNKNAEVFEIDGSLEIKQRELEAFPFSDDIKKHESSIITGYHIFDKELAIFLLEATEEGALHQLPNDASGDTMFIQLESTYHRLRTLSTPNLLHIQIKHNIREIFQWNRTYIKKDANSESYNCIEFLQKLLQVYDALPNNDSLHFPTQSMVLNFLKQYGKSKTTQESKQFTHETHPKKMKEIEPTENLLLTAVVPELIDNRESIRHHLNLDNHNDNVIKLLRNRKLRVPNYVKLNAKTNFTYEPKYKATYNNQIYNYSNQCKSQTVIELNELRNELLKDKNNIRSFGDQFLSQMISPVDAELEKVKEERISRSLWKTKKGFYSGPFKKLT